MDREATKTQMRFQSFDRLAQAMRRLPRGAASTLRRHSSKGRGYIDPC